MVLDGRPVSIVGVLPANFQYPNSRDVQVWVNPVNIVPEVFSAGADWERKLSTNHETHYLNLIARLKPGVTVQQAEADVNGIFATLHKCTHILIYCTELASQLPGNGCFFLQYPVGRQR
jgi:hypothetical protein